MKRQEITLPDGVRTTAEWFGADVAAPKAVIAFLPALGVSVEYYRGFAQAWASRGYRVAALEMRGMKHSSVRDVKRENFGYREILRTDLPALLARVRAEAAMAPFYLAGHSLGGQFALLHAARHREHIDGVVVIAGGSNYYNSMPSAGARFRRRAAVRLVRSVNSALGYFPGHKLGFGGRQPRSMIADWTHEALTGKYRLTGDATDFDAALATIAVPVIFVSLSGDPLVPSSCASFLARKLAAARLTQVELQARDLGLPRFHHFRWVRTPEPILDAIERWAGTEAHVGIEKTNPLLASIRNVAGSQ